MKRSSVKKITRTSKILRYMRVSRGIAMRKAGALTNLSDSAISHYEHGRMDVPEQRLIQLVKAYDYTMQDFRDFAAGKEIRKRSIGPTPGSYFFWQDSGLCGLSRSEASCS